MVTKYFGFLCNYVLLGFKETNSYLKNCKTIFTGTPLREQFYKFNFLPEWVPKGNGPLLIVMGGSQGAKAINQILYESLLESEARHFGIYWKLAQTKFSKNQTLKRLEELSEIESSILAETFVLPRVHS